MHARSGSLGILLLLATPALAQDQVDRNYSGLVAGLAVTRVEVEFGDEDPSGKMAGQFDIGYRAAQLCVLNLPGLCWQRYEALKPLRVTLHLAFLATDLRGMDPERDQYAYANLDVGLRFSYALGNEWRPWVTVRTGTRTTEQLGGPNEIWNRVGSGTALGGGIEIPVTATGRGLDLGVTMMTGRFTEYEFLKTVTHSELKHRAFAIHVGWSGPFTGISLPWQ